MKKIVIMLIAMALILCLVAESKIPQVSGKIHKQNKEAVGDTPQWNPIVGDIVIIEFISREDVSRNIVYQCIAMQDGTFALSPKVYHDPALFSAVKVSCHKKTVVQEIKDKMSFDLYL